MLSNLVYYERDTSKQWTDYSIYSDILGDINNFSRRIHTVVKVDVSKGTRYW
jgi:hypothetical protein